MSSLYIIDLKKNQINKALMIFHRDFKIKRLNLKNQLVFKNKFMNENIVTFRFKLLVVCVQLNETCLNLFYIYFVLVLWRTIHYIYIYNYAQRVFLYIYTCILLEQRVIEVLFLQFSFLFFVNFFFIISNLEQKMIFMISNHYKGSLAFLH